MESLTSLASSLPTAHQNAEKELLNNFKAAALSITTLYRSSRETAKRAYDAGYAAACQDLLTMIQQGVSVSGIDDTDSPEAMSIGRIMDWTEARLQALKQKEEEEEEEEKEKERERAKPVIPSAAPATLPAPKVTKSSQSNGRQKDNKTSISPTSSPVQQTVEPPISATVPMRPAQRVIKPRPSTKGDGSSPYIGLPAAHPFDFFAEPRPAVPPPSSNFPDATLSVSAGAKRRHAMMMMLDAASSPVSIDGSSAPPSSTIHMSNLTTGNGLPLGPGLGRRRTRTSRITSQQQIQNQLLQAEAMDVEEENGRERKRVARR